jgi:RNA polymerase primary sigma factor
VSIRESDHVTERGRDRLARTRSGGPLPMAYLDQMGQIPLLTPAEEVALARRAKAGATAQTMLEAEPADLDVAAVAALAEACGHPSMWAASPAGARDLCRQIAADGVVAREQLIEANLRLVVSIARHYAGRGLSTADLIQEGNLGLIRAVDKFEPERGFKLSTYATWWIRQAITRGIQNSARVIRLPVHKVISVNRLAGVRHQLRRELGREPSPAEVAEGMELTEQQVSDIALLGSHPLSLEAPVREDAKAVLGDLIEDAATEDPVETMTIAMLTDQVEELLGSLPEQEARVIELRFGFCDDLPHTVSEVSRELGMTRARVRQIERRALCRLCHPARSTTLRALLD